MIPDEVKSITFRQWHFPMKGSKFEFYKENDKFYFSFDRDEYSKVSKTQEISKKEYIQLIKKLQDNVIKKWHKTYVNNLVLDGESWSLDIENTSNSSKLKFEGSNKYPDNWEEVRNLFYSFLEDKAE